MGLAMLQEKVAAGHSGADHCAPKASESESDGETDALLGEEALSVISDASSESGKIPGRE